VFADNGSDLSGRVFDLWALRHGVEIDFSRPGKPTDNAFVESFNGSLWGECLNANWFESIEEAKVTIEARRVEYNESRPHQALGHLTPRELSLKTKELDESRSHRKI
jgi:putative transposase